MNADASRPMSPAHGSELIVVVGSINADLVVRVPRHPAPGETLTGSGGTVLPGGKGANQALAAARLGGRVAMVAAVGADAHADAALSLLRESGADLTAVRETQEPTGLAVVTVADDGENSIVIVPGANGTMDAAAVEDHAQLIASAAVVVLQGEIPRSGIEASALLARGRVILNPAPVLELDPRVLHRADPLVVNEHEASGILALLDPAGAPGAREPRALIGALLAAGVPSAVLTLGGRGALLASDEEVIEIPAVPVAAADTTGAGDAFTGALALRLAQGAGMEEAARFAARVAAFAVQGEGAQPSYPRAEDLLSSR